MNYEHKDSKTVLELWNSKASLYQNGRLLFRGDGYIAIKMFIEKSGHAPEVMKIFKNQLDMREEVKWKKKDEEMKAKEKAKADRMKEEMENSSKKEKVIRRPKRNTIDKMFTR